MLKIEGINFEFPQMGREPKMGYSDEYVEKTMISGKVVRIYKGKRFYASFSYAFLTDEQISAMREALATQRQQGYLNVEIDSPFGSFVGGAIVELGNEQSRFKYDSESGKYIWTNWQLSLKAVSYDT